MKSLVGLLYTAMKKMTEIMEKIIAIANVRSSFILLVTQSDHNDKATLK
jgi:hypothetical protein